MLLRRIPRFCRAHIFAKVLAIIEFVSYINGPFGDRFVILGRGFMVAAFMGCVCIQSKEML